MMNPGQRHPPGLASLPHHFPLALPAGTGDGKDEGVMVPVNEHVTPEKSRMAAGAKILPRARPSAGRAAPMLFAAALAVLRRLRQQAERLLQPCAEAGRGRIPPSGHGRSRSAVQATLVALHRTASQVPCPPRVIHAFSNDVQRLEVDSFRIRCPGGGDSRPRPGLLRPMAGAPAQRPGPRGSPVGRGAPRPLAGAVRPCPRRHPTGPWGLPALPGRLAPAAQRARK